MLVQGAGMLVQGAGMLIEGAGVVQDPIMQGLGLEPPASSSLSSPPESCDSLKHMKSLQAGDKVDCLDSEQRWGKVVVKDVMEDGIIIHWEGFKKSLDEKVSFNEHIRCAKAGIHVKRTAAPVQASRNKAYPKSHAKRARPVTEDDQTVPDLPATKIAKPDPEDGEGGGRSRRNCKSIFRRSG